MKFEYFRLILTEDKQLSLIPGYKNRHDAIIDLFTKDFDFTTNREKEFKYIYKITKQDYILGLIFEKQNVSLREDPLINETQKRPNWESYVVIINTGLNKGENSQLFILQSNPSYDKERRLNFLNKTLADKLNQNLKLNQSIYSAVFAPILTMNNIWDLSGRKGLKQIIIDYTMPNFLGTGDAVNKKLEELRKKVNATKVQEIVTNDNGNLIIDPNYKDLKDAVELTHQGQSRITIKDFSNTTVYDSTDNETVKSKNVSIGELDIQTQSDTEMKATFKILLKELNLDS